MAKARMIPVCTFEDPAFGQISSDAKVMFMGMVVMADDEGRLRGNPSYLASRIFPYQGFTVGQSKNILAEIIKNIKGIKLYTVENEDYIQLTKWEKYQSLRPERIVKSSFPAPTVNQMSAECQPNVSRMSAQVKLSKVKLSKDNISGVPDTKSYGNPDINDTLLYFKEKLHLPMMDGSNKDNRRYAHLLLTKFKDLTGVKKLIDFTSEDEFWKNRITSLSGLYYKGVQIIAKKRGDNGNKYRAIDATKYI